MNEAAAELFRNYCEILFSSASHPGQLYDAVHQLFDLLSGLVDYQDNQPSQEEAHDSILDSGKAISFQGAARCLWELFRSHKFLRGVEAAVRAAQHRFPGQRILLLEAGCGPFALLALPLAVRFSAAEVGFVLLDIHPRSLAAARRIVESLGLEAYVTAYVETDATTWVCPPELRPHVIVSETMQCGLRKEPQVAITRNLVPQLQAGGIFLPQRVEVSLGLITYVRPEGQDLAMPRSTIIAPLFELDPHKPDVPMNGQVTLPTTLPASFTPNLCTAIQVFEDIALGENECSLTLPVRIKELPPLQPSMVLHYEYAMGSQPGIRFLKVDQAVQTV